MLDPKVKEFISQRVQETYEKLKNIRLPLGYNRDRQMPDLALSAATFRAFIKDTTGAPVTASGEVTLKEVQEYEKVAENHFSVVAAAWMTTALTSDARAHYQGIIGKGVKYYSTPVHVALNLIEQAAAGNEIRDLDIFIRDVFKKGNASQQEELKRLCLSNPRVLSEIIAPTAVINAWNANEQYLSAKEQRNLALIQQGLPLTRADTGIHIFENSKDEEYKKIMFDRILNTFDETDSTHHYIVGSIIKSSGESDYWSNLMSEKLQGADASPFLITGAANHDMIAPLELEEAIVHSRYYVAMFGTSGISAPGREILISLRANKQDDLMRSNEFFFYSDLLNCIVNPEKLSELKEDRETLSKMFRYIKNDEEPMILDGLPTTYLAKILETCVEEKSGQFYAEMEKVEMYHSGGYAPNPEEKIFFDWAESKHLRKEISRERYEKLMTVEPSKLKMVATDSQLPEDLYLTLLYHPEPNVSYFAAGSYRNVSPEIVSEYVRCFNSGDVKTNSDTVLPFLIKILVGQLKMTTELEAEMREFVTKEQGCSKYFARYLSDNQAIELCIQHFNAFPDEAYEMMKRYNHRSSLKTINGGAVPPDNLMRLYLALSPYAKNFYEDSMMITWTGLSLYPYHYAQAMRHLAVKYPDDLTCDEGYPMNRALSILMSKSKEYETVFEDLMIESLRTRSQRQELSVKTAENADRPFSDELLQALEEAYLAGDTRESSEILNDSPHPLHILSARLFLTEDQHLALYARDDLATPKTTLQYLAFFSSNASSEIKAAALQALFNSDNEEERHSNEYLAFRDKFREGALSYLLSELKDRRLEMLETGALLELIHLLGKTRSIESA